MKVPICAEMNRPLGRAKAKDNKTSATSTAKVKVRTADAAALALGLERSSSEPLHVQLTRQLRHMILSGRVTPGARLPSTRALASELGVSRATSVLAYDQLVSEGYLEGRQGSGVFVAPSLGARSLQAAATSRPAPRSSAWRVTPKPLPARPFQINTTDPTLFPFRHWARLLNRIWRNPRLELVTKIDPFGWPDLRAAIARHLGEWRGMVCHGEQIIITSGAADAIQLIARSSFAPGDCVYLEEPGFPTLLQGVRHAGLVACPVLVDADGFDPDRAFARRAARGVIVTPSRQFPLGVTLPLRRRLQLLEWATSVGAFVIEDDFDSEYRYEGSPLPALMSLDRHGRTIYMGSFSKVLWPTLRLGFIVTPERLIGAFRRHVTQRGPITSVVAQPVLAEFMGEGAYATHIRRTRRIYARRLAALRGQSERLRDLLELSPTASGMHVIADLAPKLAQRMSDRDVAKLADQADVAVLPLADYYAGRPNRCALLLGFAAFSEQATEAAIERLAGALARR
jgi:GntR family transcriptional regulator / MocR family aminotransferase